MIGIEQAKIQIGRGSFFTWKTPASDFTEQHSLLFNAFTQADGSTTANTAAQDWDWPSPKTHRTDGEMSR